jgi:TolB-like protein
LIQDPTSERLDSWKEIAAYLKKEVRTVQRWEKNLGLPVRRLAHGKQGTVFAYKSELDSWWRESQSTIESEDHKTDAGEDSSGTSVLALAFAPGQSQKTSVPSASTHRRPHPALAYLLLTLAVAGLLGAFRHQIHDWIWPVRPKMILAVRPFRNITGDSGQDFVADGLTEEMITRLGQLHPDEMGVVRLSPGYASSDLSRIGKDVHANYVLEGGVRRSEQRVAITAQLIQVSDQTQVWAESYERDLQDVLRIQADVAGAIAGGVLNKLPYAQPSMRQVSSEASPAYVAGGAEQQHTLSGK